MRSKTYFEKVAHQGSAAISISISTRRGSGDAGIGRMTDVMARDECYTLGTFAVVWRMPVELNSSF
jgi:hypothetical protein